VTARLHPLFFAVAPILFLYAHNRSEVASVWVLAALGASLCATLVLWALSTAFLRDVDRAALVVSLFLVEFFFYGRVFDLIWHPLSRVLSANAAHALFVTVFALLLAGGVALVRSSRIDPRAWGSLLSLASGLLVLFSSVDLARSVFRSEDTPEPETAATVAPDLVDSPAKPDIYFVILDGYARADMLEKYYDFDNSAFVDALRARGFHVARNSRSNYFLTFLSLASTLNMRMLDKPKKRADRLDAYAMVKKHEVGRILHEHGYRIVHFATNYGGTETSDMADIFYSYRPPLLQNEFISVLLRTTALRPFEPNVAHLHLYMMEHIVEVPSIPGPTFTLFHLVLPHNPYVFARDGTVRENVPMTLEKQGKRESWQDKQAYIDQLGYLNGRIESIVDELIARSPNPPIIVIQSDHGSAINRDGDQRDYWIERTSTLNAIYAPPAIVARWGDAPHSVNTFRIILGELFGLDLPPLPPRFLFSKYGAPYNWKDVTKAVLSYSSPPP
jgi:hypothetical protein